MDPGIFQVDADSSGSRTTVVCNSAQIRMSILCNVLWTVSMQDKPLENIEREDHEE